MRKNSEKLNSRELENLSEIKRLLQHSLAFDLHKEGVTMQQIAKHLHTSKSSVVAMLQGIKKEA